jgi:hypothetical protein
LKNKVIAYSNGENLYLNCNVIKLQRGYAKVLSDNKYYVFTASIPQNYSNYGIEISQLRNMFGAVGGAIQGMQIAVMHFPYVMEKSTQKLTLVSDKNIRTILAANTALLEKCTADEQKSKLETILTYLITWNESN